MSLEIKPCPFCGDVVKEPLNLGRGSKTPLWEIRCSNCNVGMIDENKKHLLSRWSNRCTNRWIDDDGYPTETSLLTIKQWEGTGVGLLEFIQEIWWCADSQIKVTGKEWSLHTAGWSGNEDIIASLKANDFWWICHWESSTRGGHHRFEVDREDKI